MDEGLLLRVPLTGSLDAVRAQGDGRGRLETPEAPPVFEDDGVRPGARFSRDTCASFAVEGNFARSEGTAMPWDGRMRGWDRRRRGGGKGWKGCRMRSFWMAEK